MRHEAIANLFDSVDGSKGMLKSISVAYVLRGDVLRVQKEDECLHLNLEYGTC